MYYSTEQRRENGERSCELDRFLDNKGADSAHEQKEVQKKIEKIGKIGRLRFTSYSGLRTYYEKTIWIGDFTELFPLGSIVTFGKSIWLKPLDLQLDWKLRGFEVLIGSGAADGVEVSCSGLSVCGFRHGGQVSGFRHGGTGVGCRFRHGGQVCVRHADRCRFPRADTVWVRRMTGVGSGAQTVFGCRFWVPPRRDRCRFRTGGTGVGSAVPPRRTGVGSGLWLRLAVSAAAEQSGFRRGGRVLRLVGILIKHQRVRFDIRAAL